MSDDQVVRILTSGIDEYVKDRGEMAAPPMSDTAPDHTAEPAAPEMPPPAPVAAAEPGPHNLMMMGQHLIAALRHIADTVPQAAPIGRMLNDARVCLDAARDAFTTLKG